VVMKKVMTHVCIVSADEYIILLHAHALRVCVCVVAGMMIIV
jgi:hypothetical protein